MLVWTALHVKVGFCIEQPESKHGMYMPYKKNSGFYPLQPSDEVTCYSYIKKSKAIRLTKNIG